MLRFALIGTGWRAAFYEKLSRMLPERYQMTGVVCHSAKGREIAEGLWHARIYESFEAAAADRPDTIIASVPGSAVSEIALFFSRKDLPVLFETYCSESLRSMEDLYQLVGGARIQIAEQYPFQPMHAARIKTVSSGILGQVYEAKACFIQNYHTLAVLRRLLKIQMELPVVHAYQKENMRAAGPTRAGLPERDILETAPDEIFLLDYGDRTAIGEYEFMQQRSWIRTPLISVWGERGEIFNDQVTYLKDLRTPISYQLIRSQAGTEGNMEGFYLRGIQGRDEWLYRNPYQPVPMLDDEIAVAACLDAMEDYVKGGEAFYSLEEAFQDHYVCLLIQEAQRSGKAVRAERQIWQRG